MPASVLAAVTALEQIFFGENDIPFFRPVKIIRLQVLDVFVHDVQSYDKSLLDCDNRNGKPSVH
jgi:hypothetical protein